METRHGNHASDARARQRARAKGLCTALVCRPHTAPIVSRPVSHAAQIAALSSADGNYADLSIRHTRALGSLEASKKQSSRLKAEFGALQLHHAQLTAALEQRRETIALALEKTNKALRATSTALEQVNASSKAERAALVDAALSSLRQLRTHMTQAMRSNMPDGHTAAYEGAADGEDVARGLLEVRSLTNEADAAALFGTGTDVGAGGSTRPVPAPSAKRVSPVKTQMTAVATWRPEQGVPWPSWDPPTERARGDAPSALPSLVLQGSSDAPESAPATARAAPSMPLGRAPHHVPHPPSNTSPRAAIGGRARMNVRDAQNGLGAERGVPAGPSAMLGICVVDPPEPDTDERLSPPRRAPSLSLDPAVSSTAQASHQMADHDGTWVPQSNKPAAARTEASVAAAEATAMASRRCRDAAQATTQAQQAQARVKVDDTHAPPLASPAWRGGAVRVSLSGVEYSGVRARPKCCAS